MIPAITFGSTYTVSSKYNGYSKFSSFYDYAIDKASANDVDVLYDTETDDDYAYSANEVCTLIAPDSLDSDIELYCTYNGIKFDKRVNEELLNPQSIERRIAEPKAGMRIVNINAEKFEKLANGQDSNVKYCRNEYNKYYFDKVNTMLKSGQEIPTSSLYIVPLFANPENAINYIERHGLSAIEDNDFAIDFAQRTDYPDHCVYYALKDLGIKSIPVYMSEETYKLAQALDIVEQR